MRTTKGEALAKTLADRMTFGKAGASPLVLLDQEREATGADEAQAVAAVWAGKALAALASGVSEARVKELLPEDRDALLELGQRCLGLASAAFDKAAPKDGEAT